MNKDFYYRLKFWNRRKFSKTSGYFDGNFTGGNIFYYMCSPYVPALREHRDYLYDFYRKKLK